MNYITRLFVMQYGVPPVGKQVFTRIQRMNDNDGSIV